MPRTQTKPDLLAPALATLASRIRAHCPHDGRFDLRGVAGVRLARFSKRNTELTHTTARPVLCVVAQGAKSILLGPEVYCYDTSRMLVLSVDLPVAGQVVQASAAEPYLSLVFDLDTRRIADLVLKTFPNGQPPRRPSDGHRGIYTCDADPHILDAASRLVSLGAEERPEDAALLAPLILDEILIRLLRGPAGSRVAQIGLDESNLQRVGKAIAWLRANFAQPVRIDDLAELANMSVSTFHQHFKAVTSMSPLHYQKALRLQEARRLMLSTMMDAGSASRQVGYLSASQFSREYARFFGAAPTRDIARLIEQRLTVADVFR